jgi:hypothetical protein
MSSNEIVKRIVAEEEQRLFIPGQGFVDFRLKRAAKVVSDYDDRLILALHEGTGDWVAFIQLGPDRMFPVIGFGKELPPPDEIRAILERHDTHRHGDKLLRQIQETNDRIQGEKRKAVDNAIEEAADYAEWGIARHLGSKTRIFIPS